MVAVCPFGFGMGWERTTWVCVVGDGSPRPCRGWGQRGGGSGVTQLRVCACFVHGLGWVGLALCPFSPPMLASSQRQRLRELLIRQQIQRNSLRQEKESAAAAATPSPSGWAPEPSSQPYELSRSMATYQAPQVGWSTWGHSTEVGDGCVG